MRIFNFIKVMCHLKVIILLCFALFIIGCGGGSDGQYITPDLNISYNYNCLREFYVSSSEGNDENSGLAPSEPWKSIAKTNEASLLPGDCINLRRGDVFREMLVPSSSGTEKTPIIFKSYGLINSENPKILTTEYFNSWWQKSLIFDGSFELFDEEINAAESGWLRDDAKRWRYSTGTANSYLELTGEDSVTGLHSLRMYKDDKTTTVLIGQIVEIEPSTEYTLSLFGRRDSGSAKGYVQIKDTVNNLYLNTSGNWSALSAASDILIIFDDEWTEKEIAFKTRSNAAKIDILILNRGNDGPGGILVDAVTLFKKERSPEIYWVGTIQNVRYYYGATRGGTRLPLGNMYEKLLGTPTPFENGYFNAGYDYFFYTRDDSGEPDPIEVGARQHGILVRDREWIIIDSIDVDGPSGFTEPGAISHDAVYVDGESQHITITNLKVTNSSQYGVSSEIGTRDINFENIEATENSAGGIYIRSLGGGIRRCHSHHNARLMTDVGDSGGILVWGGALEITDNEVNNNGTGEAAGECDYIFGLRGEPKDTCREEAEISVWTPVDHLNISRNFVHDCTHGCIGVGSNASEDLKAANEWLYDRYYKYGPGYPNPPVEITENIIRTTGTSAYPPRYGIHSTSSGIKIGGNSNVRIEKNIISNIKKFSNPENDLDQNAAIYISNNGNLVPLYAQNFTIVGNIFYGNTSREIHILSLVDIQNYVIDNNVYYHEFNSSGSHWFIKMNEYLTLDDLREGIKKNYNISFDENSIFADPLFTNESGGFSSPADFRLKEDSPCHNLWGKL